jgi:hypothetical protein
MTRILTAAKDWKALCPWFALFRNPVLLGFALGVVTTECVVVAVAIWS